MAEGKDMLGGEYGTEETKSESSLERLCHSKKQNTQGCRLGYIVLKTFHWVLEGRGTGNGALTFLKNTQAQGKGGGGDLKQSPGGLITEMGIKRDPNRQRTVRLTRDEGGVF